MLLKRPKGREVADGDTFYFNDGFTDRKYKIKINAIQLRESTAEAKQTTAWMQTQVPMTLMHCLSRHGGTLRLSCSVKHRRHLPR